MTALLQAVGVGKRYRVRGPERLLPVVGAPHRRRDLWAVRGVDLEVTAGEIVGVVGRNGSGKSTLLRLIAGVATPTEGQIKRPPRIGALIELGAGFHPELTGRENVEVTGRLLGLSASEVRDRFDSIIEYAEMSAAIDRTVRQYSSGMFVRLAFSLVVHTRPQLFVVDEALAVGDEAFQVGSVEAMTTMRNAGVAVLLVSHDLDLMASIADRVVLLSDGEVLEIGDPKSVLSRYHALMTPE